MMNRKIFTSLVVMMALSIIGITWVQIVWIKNAINIYNDNFNNAVLFSLNNAAGEIETARKMNFFNNFSFNNDPILVDTSSSISGYFSFGSSVTGNGGSVSININNQTFRKGPGNEGVHSDKRPLIMSVDTTVNNDSLSLIITSAENPGEVKILRKGENAHPVPGSVYVKQNEFLEWVKKRGNEFQNMSDQMISDIYEAERTMELNVKEVENILRQNLAFSYINTPFEFAVIRNGEVGDGIIKKSGKIDFMKSMYKVRLFPDNFIRKDIVLSVVFPERRNYVLGSIVWLLIGSLLFSLFIFSTFALSLYFIVRQKKISEMKSDFINNMTHEFKTPIATISLAADTITNPKVINDENGIRHFIGMIKKENSRMNKQVETILQIASLDKKEIEFRFEEVPMHSVIGRALDTIEIQVNQRQGKLTSELSASRDIIYGDSEHLINLMHNLLDNAIKYSPEAPEITVRTIDSERGLIVSVEDKGVGMSKSVQSKIFERFYRQSSGNIHDVKGFGLGLNYVRAIVDAHKGNITVHSEPGKGSRFEIFLPYKWEN
jgi:two-component system, OmpR family, phosphate regulon sensor histidine kinase PhoR